ncbi:hypothetical protein LCGC14_0667830 [marine sediment metagenome]|uniref:Uncharacterized protein n=1 Tax=marine sediment metagenome TaxID=412755 RepID=A0A0F9QWX7_9ZZZZ
MEKLLKLLQGIYEQLEAGTITEDEAFGQAGKAFAEIDSQSDEALNASMDEIRTLAEAFGEKGAFENIKFRKEIEDGVADSAALFNTFANISESKRQIREGQEAADALVEPALPAPQTKSKELESALEDARRDKSGRPIELDPILQRNLDLLQSNLGTARTASAGQASTYGALGQNAINQARRANLAAIPSIASVQREKQGEYNRLLGASVGEDTNIYRSNLALSKQMNDRYLTEAQAAGGAIGAGRYNLALSRQGLGQGLGSMVRQGVGIARGVGNLFNMNSLDGLNSAAGDFSRDVETSLQDKFSTNFGY